MIELSLDVSNLTLIFPFFCSSYYKLLTHSLIVKHVFPDQPLKIEDIFKILNVSFYFYKHLILSKGKNKKQHLCYKF